MPNKSIFQSVTFWGAVITAGSGLFPAVAAKFGITGDAASIAAASAHIVTLIGFAVTVYGRFTAKTTVTLTGTPPAPLPPKA